MNSNKKTKTITKMILNALQITILFCIHHRILSFQHQHQHQHQYSHLLCQQHLTKAVLVPQKPIHYCSFLLKKKDAQHKSFFNMKSTSNRILNRVTIRSTLLDIEEIGDNLQNVFNDTILFPFIGSILMKDFVTVVTVLFLFVFFMLLVKPPTKLVDNGTLQNIVQGTYIEKKLDSIKCVYKASKDGWSAINFHNCVDGKGSGIVIARTITGQTFGGYNANGWRSTDDYYTSTSSFLWYIDRRFSLLSSLSSSSSTTTNNIKKLPTLSGGEAAVFDYATGGPCFGSSDLLIGPPRAAIMGGFAGPDGEDISTSAGSLRQCRSSVGSTYSIVSQKDIQWPVYGTTQLVDVEVYCVDR